MTSSGAYPYTQEDEFCIMTCSKCGKRFTMTDHEWQNIAPDVYAGDLMLLCPACQEVPLLNSCLIDPDLLRYEWLKREHPELLPAYELCCDWITRAVIGVRQLSDSALGESPCEAGLTTSPNPPFSPFEAEKML